MGFAFIGGYAARSIALLRPYRRALDIVTGTHRAIGTLKNLSIDGVDIPAVIDQPGNPFAVLLGASFMVAEARRIQLQPDRDDKLVGLFSLHQSLTHCTPTTLLDLRILIRSTRLVY